MRTTQFIFLAGAFPLISLAATVGTSAPAERCWGMTIGYNEYRTNLATGDACDASTLPCVVNAD